MVQLVLSGVSIYLYKKSVNVFEKSGVLYSRGLIGSEKSKLRGNSMLSILDIQLRFKGLTFYFLSVDSLKLFLGGVSFFIHFCASLQRLLYMR